MTQTIYLHIGHYKTGTSALQEAMSLNAKALSRKGLHYLNVLKVHNKHSSLAFSLLQAAGVTELMHGYASKATPQEIWGELFDEARRSGAKGVLASTEEFMRIGAHPVARDVLREVIAPVRAEFDFRIIVYLRPPLSHLQSWYNQLVKMNKGPVPSFHAAVCDLMEPVHYDYAQALAPWIDIFGADALIVRPYTDDLRAKGALFADFLSIFDLTPGLWIRDKDRVANPRLDDDKVEVVRILQAAGASQEYIAYAEGRLGRLRADTKRGSGNNLGAVVRRARNGLDAIASLPGNSINMASFADHMPSPDSDTYAEDITALTDVLIFLIADLRTLRTNLHKNHVDLLRRVIALEKAES